MKPSAFLFLSLGLALLSNPSRAQAWQPVVLDSTATISFPGPAESRTLEGKPVFMLRDEENTLYMVVLQQAEDQEKNLEGAELTEVYTGVVQGTLDAVGGKLLGQRPFTVRGYRGLEYELATPTRPELHTHKYQRVLYANGTLYALTYWSYKQNATSVANRQKFFSSLALSSDKAVGTAETNSRAYRFGRGVGRLAFYAFVIGGLFFLVRRVARRH